MDDELVFRILSAVPSDKLTKAGTICDAVGGITSKELYRLHKDGLLDYENADTGDGIETVCYRLNYKGTIHLRDHKSRLREPLVSMATLVLTAALFVLTLWLVVKGHVKRDECNAPPPYTPAVRKLSPAIPEYKAESEARSQYTAADPHTSCN